MMRKDSLFVRDMQTFNSACYEILQKPTLFIFFPFLFHENVSTFAFKITIYKVKDEKEFVFCNDGLNGDDRLQ